MPHSSCSRLPASTSHRAPTTARRQSSDDLERPRLTTARRDAHPPSRRRPISSGDGADLGTPTAVGERLPQTAEPTTVLDLGHCGGERSPPSASAGTAEIFGDVPPRSGPTCGPLPSHGPDVAHPLDCSVSGAEVCGASWAMIHMRSVPTSVASATARATMFETKADMVASRVRCFGCVLCGCPQVRVVKRAFTREGGQDVPPSRCSCGRGPLGDPFRWLRTSGRWSRTSRSADPTDLRLYASLRNNLCLIGGQSSWASSKQRPEGVVSWRVSEANSPL